MRFAFTAAAFVFAMPALAFAQTTKFNLACSGSLQSLAPAALIDKTEPYSATYRIDLDAMKWCEADCSTTHSIVEVTPTALTLQSKTVDTPRELDKLRNYISRETGRHSITAEAGTGASHMAMFWKGQCEASAFTGFPTPVTKF
jgi:hypothetical protein